MLRRQRDFVCDAEARDRLPRPNAQVGTVSYADSTSTSTLSWTGDLTPGEVVTITYSVTVNNPDTGNQILASTVTSPGIPRRSARPADATARR